MTEEWRPILGWEGYYEASDQGRVRSVDRLIFTATSDRFLKGRILRPRRHKAGYLFLVLCREGVPYTRTVHSLVLLAFEGSRPVGLETRHLDGNQLNNLRSNLCYGSAKDNADDRIRHGTVSRIPSAVGEDHYAHVLTEDDVRYIRSNLFRTNVDLADQFGVAPTTVSAVRNAKTWRHLI